MPEIGFVLGGEVRRHIAHPHAFGFQKITHIERHTLEFTEVCGDFGICAGQPVQSQFERQIDRLITGQNQQGKGAGQGDQQIFSVTAIGKQDGFLTQGKVFPLADNLLIFIHFNLSNRAQILMQPGFPVARINQVDTAEGDAVFLAVIKIAEQTPAFRDPLVALDIPQTAAVTDRDQG